MSEPAPSLALIDWQVVAGGFATFFVTAYLTWKGWKDRKKEIAEAPTAIVGGVLQDSITLAQNTASLVDLEKAVEENTQELRHLTAEIRRLADVMLMTAHSSRR